MMHQRHPNSAFTFSVTDNKGKKNKEERREKREVGQASGAPRAPEKKVSKVNLEERSESTVNYRVFYCMVVSRKKVEKRHANTTLFDLRRHVDG